MDNPNIFYYSNIKEKRREQLSIENCAKVSAFCSSGFSQRQIIDQMWSHYHVKVSKSTVQRVLANENARGTVIWRPRSGRPRVTTLRLDRSLVRMALESRKQTLRLISTNFEQIHQIKVSKQTISRRLKDAGLRIYRCRRKPLLSIANVLKRKSWAKKYQNHPLNYWKLVMWSDKCRFCRVSGELHMKTE